MSFSTMKLSASIPCISAAVLLRYAGMVVRHFGFVRLLKNPRASSLNWSKSSSTAWVIQNLRSREPRYHYCQQDNRWSFLGLLHALLRMLCCYGYGHYDRYTFSPFSGTHRRLQYFHGKYGRYNYYCLISRPSRPVRVLWIHKPVALPFFGVR